MSDLAEKLFTFNGTEFSEGPIISIDGLMLIPDTTPSTTSDEFDISEQTMDKKYFLSKVEIFKTVNDSIRDEIVGLTSTFYQYLAKSFAASLRYG